ncbi:C39 family peptidase [Ralstonia solanacearum]|uniref:Peptidase C39 n=1 Tax=Ralstonia solanacearum K60 TaxID=1091042 RepID=A0AAP7ZLP0_RALSL|nr:C39 family peptidase [Ralstonia solanacearum]MBT1537138.1 C39 family peptidase [Ralstonia solanacearum]OYQ12885.1 peptidase C39 [Ralstonia solanacearum K60]QOK83231.1 peptidase C39 [Ralstonia solanacearum]RIJ87357.1 peptidase C39 [Ralstonia solanacearum]CCF97220.1 putative bacteriocin processing protein,Peptidase C39 family, exported [Ralstonia solanacearum K60]
MRGKGWATLMAIAGVLAPLLVPASARAGEIDMPGMGGALYAVPVTSMKEMRFLRTIRQRFDFSCGSAAVATLLTYQYGYPVSEQVVFEAMYRHGNQEKIRREGFSLLDIKRYLESLGFEADGFEQPLDALKDAHLPAIVLLSENGYHHFVVVKGVQEGRVLVGDPAMGTRAIPRASFEGMWDNHLLFVIHNREERAAFNAGADWRVAPRAPLAEGVERSGLGDIVIPKHGPGDF